MSDQAERPKFHKQLEKALAVPQDRVWFGTGLLTVAKVQRERMEKAEAERDALQKRVQVLEEQLSETTKQRNLVGKDADHYLEETERLQKRVQELEQEIRDLREDTNSAQVQRSRDADKFSREGY